MNRIITCIILSCIPFLKASADIIYTDVADQTVTQSSSGQSIPYVIDLNQDGSADFEIIASKGMYAIPDGSFNGDAVVMLPSGGMNNQILDLDASTERFARALELATSIHPSSTTWDNEIGVLAANGTATPTGFPFGLPISGGDFYNKTDKYLGVKFFIGTEAHYGWIRIDVVNYNSFTVKDFAYETVVDRSIPAGQIFSTGISEYLKENTIVKNNNNLLELEFVNPFEGTIQIVNTNGQVMTSGKAEGKYFQINMTAMSPGIYNLVISNHEGIAAKKVMIY